MSEDELRARIAELERERDELIFDRTYGLELEHLGFARLRAITAECHRAVAVVRRLRALLEDIHGSMDHRCTDEPGTGACTICVALYATAAWDTP